MTKSEKRYCDNRSVVIPTDLLKKVTPSSGNIFQDLGLKDAEESQTKVKLVFRVNSIIEKRGYTKAEASKALKISQVKVVALKKGRLNHFTITELINFLTMLDQDVSISVQRKPNSRKNHGQLSVILL